MFYFGKLTGACNVPLALITSLLLGLTVLHNVVNIVLQCRNITQSMVVDVR